MNLFLSTVLFLLIAPTAVLFGFYVLTLFVERVQARRTDRYVDALNARVLYGALSR